MKTRFQAFFVLLLTSLHGLASNAEQPQVIQEDQSTAPAKLAVPIDDSFTYKAVDNKELRIDWTRPVDWNRSDKRAAVVFFHGGGWVGGAPGQFEPHSIELAQRGVVCFRVQYRLISKKDPGPPANAVADVSDAFRFIRASATRFGIDPKRMAAAGGSAGGHLAAFLGMMDDEVVDGISRKPNSLCLFNPVFDNGPGQWGHKRVGDEYPKYSPAHNITADDPPACVFLGTKDALIPVAVAERFRDKMEKAGVESRLFLYENQQHGFFNFREGNDLYYRQTVDSMLEFLSDQGWFQKI